MPTDHEIRNAIAILTAGRVIPPAAGEFAKYRGEAAALREAQAYGPRIRAGAATAGRGIKFGFRQAVTKNPWGIAALLAYEGYIHRDEIADLAVSLGAEDIPSIDIPGVRGSAVTAFKKRALSKANRAVKFAMGELKAGAKASTGADKGKLPKGAFKTATKAAGLANPRTPSKIGKGKGKAKNLARKIKRWW